MSDDTSTGLQTFYYTVGLQTRLRFQDVTLRVRGSYRASSADDASACLKAAGLSILRLSPTSNLPLSKAFAHQGDLLRFWSHMVTMVELGGDFAAALRGAAASTDSPALRVTLLILASDIMSGYDPSQALQRQPGVFPAELSLALSAPKPSVFLESYLDNQRKSDERSHRFQKLLYYPMMIAMVLFSVLTLLWDKVFPTMDLVLSELPGTLVNAGQTGFFEQFPASVLGAFFRLILIVILALLAFRMISPRFYRRSLQLVNGMRGVRMLELRAVVCQRLAHFLEHGYPLIPAIQHIMVGGMPGSFRRDLSDAVRALERGDELPGALHNLFGSWSDALADSSLPAWIIFREMARDYRERAETRFEQVQKVFIPGIIVVLGVLVGVIVYHTLTFGFKISSSLSMLL